MSAVDPYIFFDGNCADAMRFYERVLGAQAEIMTGDQAPPGQIDPKYAGQVMHARLALPGGRSLMASDVMGQPYEGMKGFALSLGYDDVAEARRVFDALSEGGQVQMPLDKTFWAEAFGMLTDRFGTPWMVSGGHQQE